MSWVKLTSVLFLIVSTVVGSLAHGPFSGHKVIRVSPQTDQEVDVLKNLLSQKSDLDIWKEPSCATCNVDIRLSPFDYDDVISVLQENGFHPKILISDVQGILDSQRKPLRFRPKSSDFDYSKYHTLDDNVSNAYKTIVSVFNVTTSYEGRPLTGIKISTPSTFPQKPSFWIEGGIHAREWISPATMLFMAGQMLDNYKKDPDITKMVDMFDWYILPVTNPDGYVYTWKSDKTRLWRKTRSKQGLCFGVDPNRNWDIEWCKTGASKDPCADTYCGPSAFSEVEVKGVADFVSKLPNLKGFIDFHSYSQLWMTPWGYTKKLPKDFTQMDEGAATAVKALAKLYGTKYGHGSIANIIYEASGSSADWTYGKLGVKYSYGVELRDTGKYGFLLPEDQIIPTGRETLDAMIALSNYINQN